MAVRPQERNGSRLGLDELEDLARSSAAQVWGHDERLAEQQEQLSLSYIDWLNRHFPHVVTRPFGERHLRLWEWIDSLKAGVTPPAPQVEVWPRGGGKSTTLELGCAYVGQRLSRRFVLYVCGTQDQADKHVGSIATLFEHIGVERSLNKFGNSKGWRRNQLRTAAGFNVEGIGLDVAARGIKLDEIRPDWIIVDDIDTVEDTASTTAKKSRALSKSLIPTGGTECAYSAVQNLIIEDGVIAQLYDGRADFLHGRRCFLEKAVEGLEVEPYTAGDSSTKYRIIRGEPTWLGQDLEVCERQINDWGLRSFQEEAQHDVASVRGYFFDESKLEIVQEYPELVKVCRAWDDAGTQGGGDYSVGVLIGISPNGMCWVLDVVRAQLASDNLITLKRLVTDWDRRIWGKKYTVRIPQDPGSAGLRVASEDAKELKATATPVIRKKALRAKKWAEKLNSGNARLLQDGRPRTPEIDEFLDRVTRQTALEGKALLWNREFKTEHRKFREDETHEFDDQVDAATDAYGELEGPSQAWDW